MDKKEVIEELQSQIRHRHISDINELIVAVRKTGLDIDAYEDIIFPMGYNVCDRCGYICDSEVELFWIDGFDWEDGNPKDEAILAGINAEGEDYCAVCYECLKKLEEKGRKVLTK